MDLLNFSKCKDFSHSLDPNNNLEASMKSYSLRPRTSRKCEEEENIPNATNHERWRPPRASKKKQKSMPLSKYRRKTANARERSRMREINEAFESLRRVIPHSEPSSRDPNSEKMTKITTLRLAMKYISALNNLLHDQDFESDGESFFSDYTLTPPEASMTSPELLDPSTTPTDFFSPLLTPELAPSSLAVFAGEPPIHSFQTAPLDPCTAPLDATFETDSYEFEDESFLVDFT